MFLQYDGLTFLGYYVLDAWKGAIVPLSLMMSATADVAHPDMRATLFSLIMVEMSIAMILAAGLGGLLTAATAANTAVALFATNMTVYSLFMPGTPAYSATL
jgi:hypothetical protein